MTFERFVDKLRLWGRPWLAGTEPVELHRAILEEIDAQVVAVGGGRRVFPFDRVEVKLLAPTPEDAARLAAIAEAAWDLDREAAARLKAAGATVPPGLAVSLQVTEEDAPAFAGRRYAVAFRRAGAAARPAVAGTVDAGVAAAVSVVSAASVAAPAAPSAGSSGATAPDFAGDSTAAEPDGGLDPTEVPTARLPLSPGTDAGKAPSAGAARTAGAPGAAGSASAGAGAAEKPAPAAAARPTPPRAASGRPPLHLSVLKGVAARGTYELDGERVYLGRLDEVLDATGRVKRRNDVAFVEEGEINQTVSREHARIAWDADVGAWRLRDENSASGTLLFRAGRSIEVSRHDRRGIRLESGDEVYLGRAALRIEIGPVPPR